MTKNEKDAQFKSNLSGILQYHESMLADNFRNKLLYEALQKQISSETNFLDIGAGVGVWAILAAKLGAKRVVAVEIEECLIPIIFRHAQEEGVADKIEIILGNSDDVKIRGKFDVIVSELFSNNAFGAKTINSFISLRERFLAPSGVLIPQKLAFFAAPVFLENSINEIPLKGDFLKSLRLNYPRILTLEERKKMKFAAEPKEFLEVNFQTISEPPSLKNLTASWKTDKLNEINAFAVFSHSSFSEQLEMNSFDSQSWGTASYKFEPFTESSGEIKFELSLSAENSNWSVSLPSNPEIKSQNYSPVFSFAKLRMAQQTTPHKKFKPQRVRK